MTRKELNEAVEIVKAIDSYKRILQNFKNCIFRIEASGVVTALPESEKEFWRETIERRMDMLENTFDLL